MGERKVMESFNLWLEHWEPLWLAGILFFEGFIGVLTFTILLVEYFYDKQVEEKKSSRRKVTKKQVTIQVDKDGQVKILECPKGIDVSIDHESV